VAWDIAYFINGFVARALEFAKGEILNESREVMPMRK